MQKIQLGHHQKGRTYKNPILWAIVDDKDFEKVNSLRWYAWWNPTSRSFYAVRHTAKEKIPMHRFIMNAPVGKEVDHKNHDTLDNRRSNLRIATTSENQANGRRHRDSKSEYKGVCYHKRDGKFVAKVQHKKVLYNLGYFNTAKAAAVAYNKKARELFGKFALLNKI